MFVLLYSQTFSAATRFVFRMAIIETPQDSNETGKENTTANTIRCDALRSNPIAFKSCEEVHKGK